MVENMHLDEITLAHTRTLTRTRWGRERNIFDWLERNDFELLGEGGYASVWTDDRRSVVKVFENDPCYAMFVNFCRHHRGNPHLPRVTKIYPIKKNSGIVFMELLKPSKHLHDKIIEGAQGYVYWLNQTRLNFAVSERIIKKATDFAEKNGSLSAILDELITECPLDGCRVDLHVNNFMYRGDTLVIIDPFAS